MSGVWANVRFIMVVFVVGVSASASAQFGGVRVDTRGPVCRAIAAELRAVGVQLSPFANRVVVCEPRIEFRDAQVVIEFANVGSSDVLASRVAEAVRARLLRIESPSSNSTPSAESGSSTVSTPVGSDPPEAVEPGRETQQPGTETQQPMPSPASRADTDVARTIHGSVFATVGGVFGRSALLPSVGGTLGVALHTPRFVVRAAFGGYGLSAGVEIFADELPESASLRTRLVELSVSASFVQRLHRLPLSLSLGAGVSALRVTLHSTAASSLGLQGGQTGAWTAVPFGVGEFVVHLGDRWALRGVVRVGAFARGIRVLPPEELADFSSLAFEGWWLNAALALEVAWG